ncbi:TniQ family protein [Loktanella sp. SALINAS62]|uniref:TniQ family protein n=1 Tax=Loktanella sp. SALINAS62 TaxID=2706124 RepID=UPI001B8D375C|nr:TniQ family protein [Loktanella sp. SALINAS62]MBS1301525.1 TniQ family protein [Loktanella sp. SALINAS62]
MTLLPVLPICEDETLTSYLGRVGKFHFDLSAYRFLDLIEFSRERAKHPSHEDLDRLSGLTGVARDRLVDAVALRAESRQRRFRGQMFSTAFMNANQTSFCPSCLLEDEQFDSASNGSRVARVLWRVEPVRVCGKHHIELVRRPNRSVSEQFQDMELVAPSTKDLKDLSAATRKSSPSALQLYVARRFAGENGPAWLDEQDIDQAARACEMLGIVISLGTHINLNKLTVHDRIAAEDFGYGFASRGPEGVNEALHVLFASRNNLSKNCGPQFVFGRLYQWLQFNTNKREIGPLKGLVREFVIDNFPIGAGSDLFGEPVLERKFHSIVSLSKQSGVHPKTLNRAVVLTSLAEGDPESLAQTGLVPAGAGESLAKRIFSAITRSEVCSLLNCNRVQGEQFISSGLIPMICKTSVPTIGILCRTTKSDAELFLSKMMSSTKHVGKASIGMLSIHDAAEQSRCPIIDIVRWIVEGRLHRIETLDPNQKFKGLLVNLQEVMGNRVVDQQDHLMSATQAADYLNMKTHQVFALSRTYAPDGSLNLRLQKVTNGKGVQHSFFDRSDVVRFRERFMSLEEIAQAHQLSARWMKPKLEKAGVKPCLPRDGLGGYYYRRSDLDRAIG